jgi:hypothetical protein
MARLTAKALTNFQSVNSFQYANQWTVRAGDNSTLYFQLVDMEQGSFNSIGNQAYGTPMNSLAGNVGLRYMAGIGGGNTPVVVTVTFPSIDTAKTLQYSATVNSSDPSIFSVSIPTTAIPSGGNVIIKVEEGSNVKTFSVLNMIAVEFPGNDGCDGSLPSPCDS